MEKWDRPLPPAIVAMCRIVKCEICEACFNSGLMAKSHYEGKNHEKKLRACLEVYCNKHSLELPRRVTSLAEETFRNSETNMCSLSGISTLRSAGSAIRDAATTGKRRLALSVKCLNVRVEAGT